MIRVRTVRLIVACALLGLLVSCAGFHYRFAEDRGAAAVLARPLPSYPAARFAVMSDPHLYDASLGVEGAAFQEYMDNDRKLLPESREILVTALERVKGLGVSFLLVCGDLTKDGERQDHRLMAKELSELKRSGIRVYVIPGNHDILNPHAMSFSVEGRTPVPSVTPAEFAEIYNDFGYGDALARDPGSLSYVAEPVPGLWLLAVDSANYAGNIARGRPETGAGLTQGRIDWIEETLSEARRRDKAVIVMMHHGVVEHFPGQGRFYGEYLVNDRAKVAAMYAATACARSSPGTSTPRTSRGPGRIPAACCTTSRPVPSPPSLIPCGASRSPNHRRCRSDRASSRSCPPSPRKAGPSRILPGNPS